MDFLRKIEIMEKVVKSVSLPLQKRSDREDGSPKQNKKAHAIFRMVLL